MIYDNEGLHGIPDIALFPLNINLISLYFTQFEFLSFGAHIMFNLISTIHVLIFDIE